MNDRIPEVSIGLPVYQGERFLEGTIESLLNQTFRDVELVICDNASTDRTEQICRNYAASDPRVRYYRNSTNLGPFKNYWRVLELSRAPYFKWNSANDICLPNLVESCLKALKEHPDAALAYMKTKLVDDDLNVLEEFEDQLDLQDERPSDRYIAFMARFRLANALSGVMRTEALKKVKPFGEYRASDVVMMAELAMVGKFVEVPEFGFLRRVGKQTSTTHRNGDELHKFYFPGSRRRTQLVLWRLCTEHLRSVLRVKIPFRDRMRLIIFVLRSFHWNRQILQRELLGYAGFSTEETPSEVAGLTAQPHESEPTKTSNETKG